MRTSSGLIVIASLILVSPASAQKSPVFSPKTLDVVAGKVVDFHTREDPPIHLGDNSGSIEDIPGNLRNLDAPRAYGWTFNLSRAPKFGNLIVEVYSVAAHSTGCYTIVRLNGKELTNLSLEPTVGSGVTTTKAIALDVSHLRMGPNELVISEDKCQGSYSVPSWNDSLIRGVRLEVFE